MEKFFEKLFGNWGAFVARNPCKVFWLAFLFAIGLASGMAQTSTYSDESVIWTPSGNPSLEANKRAGEMFQSNVGFISVMFEVKNAEDESASLVTLEAYKEMSTVQDLILSHEYSFKNESEPSGETTIKFDALCIKIGPRCSLGNNPLSFALDSTGAVDLSQFATDAALLAQV